MIQSNAIRPGFSSTATIASMVEQAEGLAAYWRERFVVARCTKTGALQIITPRRLEIMADVEVAATVLPGKKVQASPYIVKKEEGHLLAEFLPGRTSRQEAVKSTLVKTGPRKAALRTLDLESIGGKP